MTDNDGSSAGGTAGVGETADADLVLRTRSGDRDAFAELWRRHYRSGITVARSVTSSLDPDDLVQEAYARIFQAIQKGGGPTGSFRAYLFTSIRNTAAGWGRARREMAIDELDAVEDPASSEHAADEALDRSLTATAFRSLPTRWQEVLWYSEIEGMKPSAIAPLLGMKATAVAQLAFRAREGLREAWIQAHLQSVADGSDCAWTIERLGAYSRGNLGVRDGAKLERHLGECARCMIVAAEAKDVSRRLALVLLPLTIGIAGSTAYLASLQGGGVPIAAMAAMPSSVMDGAVMEGSAGDASGSAGVGGAGGAGAGGSAGGGAGVGAAGVVAGGAAGGIFSGVGALVGLGAAAVVIAGAVVAGAVVPGLLSGGQGPAPQAGIIAPPDDTADDDGVVLPATTPTPTPTPPPADEDEVDLEAIDDVAPVTPVVPTTPARPSTPASPAPVEPEEPSPTEPEEPETSGPEEPGPTDPTGPEEPGPTDPTDPEDPGPTDPMDPEDPGPTDPEDPELPEGSPAIGDTTSSVDAEGRTTLAVTLSGEPGATVRGLIGDRIGDEQTIGADGTVTLELRPTLIEFLIDETVSFVYVAGDQTGPASTTTALTLLNASTPA